MKKLIPLMILGAFLGASVIGCGPGPSTPANTPPPAGDKDKTKDKVVDKTDKGDK